MIEFRRGHGHQRGNEMIGVNPVLTCLGARQRDSKNHGGRARLTSGTSGQETAGDRAFTLLSLSIRNEKRLHLSSGLERRVCRLAGLKRTFQAGS
jgi:hypothetical protein